MTCDSYSLIYDVYEANLCDIKIRDIILYFKPGECFRINTARLMEEGSFIRRLYGYEVFKMNEKDKVRDYYSLNLNEKKRMDE